MLKHSNQVSTVEQINQMTYSLRQHTLEISGTTARPGFRYDWISSKARSDCNALS